MSTELSRTSHHEPMMRAHKEYTRRKEEVGPWDYKTNKERLDNFFRKGMERNKNFENVVTIGMRGDGDVAMSKEGDEANMQVLKKVIEGQRQVLKEVYGKEPSEIPSYGLYSPKCNVIMMLVLQYPMM